MANKWVYTFKEGNMTMRNLLGGKGANLAEMTEIGLPVPQGFTITTEACTQYYEDGRKINDEIMAQAMEGVAWMEKENGKKFGDLKNPLLVSVRSGARASMPGMMDTILNLGLNDDVVAAMIAGNPDPKFERFVYDSYRRFIQMFSDVVMEVGKKYFEQLIDKMKADRGVKFDVDLTAADLKELAEQFKAEYKNQLGTEFPSDPVEQLKLAIEAVFRSWDNPRANVYRRDNDIPYSWGTAVNVMPMVFGNLNDQSGTGVAFTRDPATGENKLMGEFLIDYQNLRFFHHNFSNLYKLSGLKIKLLHKHFACYIIDTDIFHHPGRIRIHFLTINQAELILILFRLRKENILSYRNPRYCSALLNNHSNSLVKCIDHAKRLPALSLKCHRTAVTFLHSCYNRSNR